MLTGTRREDDCPSLARSSGGSIGLANLLERGLISASDFNYLIISVAGEVLFQKLKDTVRVSKRGVLLYIVRLIRSRLVRPGFFIILAAVPSREQTVQLIGWTGEVGIDQKGSIGIFLHVGHVVIARISFHVLNDIPYHAADEGDVCPGSHAGIQVSFSRGAGEAGVNMDNLGTLILSSGSPLKGYRERFSHVAADNHDTVTVAQVYPVV